MKLTSEDLKAIQDLMEVTIEDKGVTKSEFEERISHLPTKDEFYTETVRIYKKLEDIESEKDILAHRSANHEDRIKSVETHLHIPTVD